MTNSFRPSYLTKRRDPNRPMVNITMRLPQDVIDDLKTIAPMVGFRGYETLIRAYISQGLMKHIAEINQSGYAPLTAALRRRGLSDEDIADIVREWKTGAAETSAGENEDSTALSECP
jgi:hypothetical protein